MVETGGVRQPHKEYATNGAGETHVDQRYSAYPTTRCQRNPQMPLPTKYNNIFKFNTYQLSLIE
jgi:hypothetical protein